MLAEWQRFRLVSDSHRLHFMYSVSCFTFLFLWLKEWVQRFMLVTCPRIKYYSSKRLSLRLRSVKLEQADLTPNLRQEKKHNFRLVPVRPAKNVPF